MGQPFERFTFVIRGQRRNRTNYAQWASQNAECGSFEYYESSSGMVPKHSVDMSRPLAISRLASPNSSIKRRLSDKGLLCFFRWNA